MTVTAANSVSGGGIHEAVTGRRDSASCARPHKKNTSAAIANAQPTAAAITNVRFCTARRARTFAGCASWLEDASAIQRNCNFKSWTL